MDIGGGSGLSLRRLAEAASVSSSGSSAPAASFHPSANTSLPILVIAILGIAATIFLLVSYYVFVIKCCLNWQRIDLLGRFSVSQRHRGNRGHQFLLHSPEAESRGLDEAVIRSIPIFQYKSKGKLSRDLDSNCECAVCLNEFQEDEKCRVIPNCNHVFHIDCIDIWLQNNANCPLCRTSVSAWRTTATAFDMESQIVALSPSSQDPVNIHSDEAYVVIDLGEPSSNPAAISGKDIGSNHKDLLPKRSSLEDESIDTIGLRLLPRLEPVQPIRRSISMDSAKDRQLLLAVQEIVQQRRKHRELQKSLSSFSFSPIERSYSGSGGSSSTLRRTFFSFGHGRASRSAVQPLCLELEA
ncbi:hypothetical protein SAY87_028263 [Trapa incisa]|uniref:RING-type E3 ubiquitin transferase n=1 Tax=Trapa incisa TaxID=236973 RepID=A0AAN7KVC0_9MYRT|nr:hypothetical protein SAY87_028263 [Trapa incisa]